MDDIELGWCMKVDPSIELLCLERALLACRSHSASDYRAERLVEREEPLKENCERSRSIAVFNPRLTWLGGTFVGSFWKGHASLLGNSTVLLGRWGILGSKGEGCGGFS